MLSLKFKLLSFNNSKKFDGLPIPANAHIFFPLTIFSLSNKLSNEEFYENDVLYEWK